MRTLTEQGHQHTPAAYSEDCVSDEPMWMIQQDLGKRINAPHDNPQWMERVADALAEIHGNNMNRGKEMPWLPQADSDYWEKIVTQISVDHFEKALSLTFYKLCQHLKPLVNICEMEGKHNTKS